MASWRSSCGDRKGRSGPRGSDGREAMMGTKRARKVDRSPTPRRTPSFRLCFDFGAWGASGPRKMQNASLEAGSVSARHPNRAVPGEPEDPCTSMHTVSHSPSTPAGLPWSPISAAQACDGHFTQCEVTIKNPRSRIRGLPFVRGEIHPLIMKSVGSGRNQRFPDSYFANWA